MTSKKRIGIITRHSVSNYGSVLQASALQWVLRDLGYDTCYLNYRPKCDAPHKVIRMGPQLPVTVLRSASKKLSELQFERMRRGLLSQTALVREKSDLRAQSDEFDALCVGGDQVWNVLPDGNVDGAYLLDFAGHETPRFSYASSLGSGTVSDKDRARFASSLSLFDRVSIRESSGLGVLANLGIRASRVVDPVHLLPPEEWDRKVTLKEPRGLESDKFVLLYSLNPDAEFESYLHSTLDHSDLRVVSIRPSLRHTYGENLLYPSVAEFLWMFKNAKVIYTDSFHGTAFSILFNTPFVAWTPQRYHDRNTSLLDMFGLSDRLAIRMLSNDPANMDDRWSAVNSQLASLRLASMDFLSEAAARAVN